jgi:hypothetical protein
VQEYEQGKAIPNNQVGACVLYHALCLIEHTRAHTFPLLPFFITLRPA